jgi:TfoX/Sxy family transcriptional regulator of competence genes
MAYDTNLGPRIREVLKNRRDIVEKQMFGGVAYMVNGNMAVGIVKDDLMVRVGPDAHDEALTRPHTRPMDFAGRPMRGMVYVAPAGVSTDAALGDWVHRAVDHALTLPAKKAKSTTTKKTKSKPPKAKSTTKKTPAKRKKR